MVAEVRDVIENEDVVETVVVNLLLLLVGVVGGGPVVAGSDRRSAGLCRTKLKVRAGMVVVGGRGGAGRAGRREVKMRRLSRTVRETLTWSESGGAVRCGAVRCGMQRVVLLPAVRCE